LLQAATIDRVQVLEAPSARCVSRRWSSGGHHHVALQGLDGLDRSSGADNGREAQFRRVFERAFQALAAQGIGPTGLVRTWFYVDRIGESYADFNRARHAAFSAAGLLRRASEARSLPASTAIGCKNSRGAAVILDLVAVDDVAARRLETLASPVQPEALSYGAAFARANRLRGEGLDTVHLSGTAAIGPHGETLFPADAESQIRATLEGVARLLGACGTDLSRVAAATAFVKRAADAPLFEGASRALGIPLHACVPVVADVCRDDLLFELDAELVFETGVDFS
jgi:enamine deaminase RidA (YjgF/YER057c/UK114 family)